MYTSIDVSRLILKIYCTVLHRTCEVKGRTSLPRGPKIIAMNHSPGCNALYLPFSLEETPHILFQDGLFTLPVLGWILRKTGQIPVHRETARARESLDHACAILRAGGTVAIFPEGKEVPLGQRVPAKTGAVRMSIETGAPIIPLALFVPPQNLTHVQFNLRGRPISGVWQFSGRSYMRFGAAWKPVSHSDIHAQTKELMDRIYSLVAEEERDLQCGSHTLLNPILQ